jgi:flagellar basal body-associated protein FliL
MNPPSIAAATPDRSGANAAAGRLLLGLAGVLLSVAVVGVPAWVFNDYFDHKTEAAQQSLDTKLELQAQRLQLAEIQKQLAEVKDQRMRDRRVLDAIAKKLRVDVD